MDVLLEIFKYTLPAIIVFITVYYLMRSHLQGQLSMKKMEYQHEQQNVSLPLRLQAYERLILLCERISVDSLLLRLRTPEMKSADLKNVLMLAIKQEFDHNLAQQLYVSSKLWEVLSAAKNQLLEQIILAEKEANSDDASKYSSELLKLFQKHNPVATAKNAVVKEGQMYF